MNGLLKLLDVNWLVRDLQMINNCSNCPNINICEKVFYIHNFKDNYFEEFGGLNDEGTKTL